MPYVESWLSFLYSRLKEGAVVSAIAVNPFAGSDEEYILYPLTNVSRVSVHVICMPSPPSLIVILTASGAFAGISMRDTICIRLFPGSAVARNMSSVQVIRDMADGFSVSALPLPAAPNFLKYLPRESKTCILFLL